MFTSTKIEKLTREELKLMIELCNFVYPDFENQSLSRIARIISKEFKTICLEEDLETYYSDDLVDVDFELESRKIEYNYDYNRC
tara:strand:- start:1219 stop:1470 length:252 start_codon:yes stop_codon:yes gene_type:complete